MYARDVPRYEIAMLRSRGRSGDDSSSRNRYYESKQLRKRATRCLDLSRNRTGGPVPGGATDVVLDFLPLALQDRSNVSGDDETPASRGETLEERLTRRTKEFNQQTRARPQDVELWMSFVHFQAEFAPLTRRRRKSALGAIAEKKISILARALALNPASERLLYAYLELCSEVWEPPKARQAWQAAVQQHPSSVRLWRRYLAFSIGSFGAFTLTAAGEAYSSALLKLSQAASAAAAAATVASSSGAKGHEAAAKQQAGLERAHQALLVDYAYVLQRAGYHERAVGLLQAAVELNCFAPGELLLSSPSPKLQPHCSQSASEHVYTLYDDDDVPVLPCENA
eukprot:COSAG05_NODE_142_length_16591_cov_6.726837_3_plen_340_part_00